MNAHVQPIAATPIASPILAAFAEHRDAYSALYQLPDTATDGEEHAQFLRIDRARDTMLGTTAITPAEHAAKLRVALQSIDQDGQDALLTLDLRELMDEDCRDAVDLPNGDLFLNMIWHTIGELERQTPRASGCWPELMAEFYKATSDLAALPSPVKDDDIDRLADAQLSAAMEIFPVPAPSVAALAEKLDVVLHVYGDSVAPKDVLTSLLNDARRLAHVSTVQTAEADHV